MPWIASGSASIRSTVWRGCSEPYGSWNTICTSRRNAFVPGSGARCASAPELASTDPTARRTVPEAIGASPHSARSTVVLPEPDSPTMPKLSPGATPSDVSAMATKRPYVTRRCEASSPKPPRTPSGMGSPAPMRFAGLTRPSLRPFRLAIERRQRMPVFAGPRQAFDQSAGVRMRRGGELAGLGLFDDAAAIHDENPVAESGDETKIVRDEDESHSA